MTNPILTALEAKAQLKSCADQMKRIRELIAESKKMDAELNAKTKASTARPYEKQDTGTLVWSLKFLKGFTEADKAAIRAELDFRNVTLSKTGFSISLKK